MLKLITRWIIHTLQMFSIAIHIIYFYSNVISKVTWDPESGHPLSKLDRELDDILKGDEELECIGMTLLNSTIDCPATGPPPANFEP